MAAKKKSSPQKKTTPKKKPQHAAARKTAPKKSSASKSSSKKTASKPGARRKPASTSAGGRKAAGKRPARTSKRPSAQRKLAPKKSAAKAPKPKLVLPEAKEALALARSIAAVAVDKKAQEVLILDVRAHSEAVGYDYVVLASGESDRQLSAIHEGVDELLKPQGKRAASVEASPDWVCVNYDEGVIAHFFTPDRRQTMNLEGLWHEAPRIAP